MAYAGSSGGAAEPAVGNQGHRVPQAHAHNGRGGVKHFPHSRPPLWPLVPNNHHVSRLNFSSIDGSLGVLFTLEHPGWALMNQHFRQYGGALYHAALRGQVAL